VQRASHIEAWIDAAAVLAKFHRASAELSAVKNRQENKTKKGQDEGEGVWIGRWMGPHWMPGRGYWAIGIDLRYCFLGQKREMFHTPILCMP